MAKSTGATALTIGAWFVAAYVALKFLPSIAKGLGQQFASAQGQTQYSPFYGNALRSTYGSGPIPSEYSNGGTIPFKDLLNLNGLPADSQATLQGFYNVTQGKNFDGSSYQTDSLGDVVPYSDPTIGTQIPYSQLATVPDSFYDGLAYTPDSNQDANSDTPDPVAAAADAGGDDGYSDYYIFGADEPDGS